MAVHDILKDVPDDLMNNFSSCSDLESPLCVPQDRIEDIELYSIFLEGFNLYPECEIDAVHKAEEEEESKTAAQQAVKKRVASPLEGREGFSNRRQRSKRDSKAKGARFARNNTSLTDEMSKRICSHCETTETPQWRMGPKGPKTLCNACGVRYKSGRLVPEYRPAASPTFDCRTHSNFHRKIMKKKKKSEIIY